jgi:hypothetical protein
MHSTPEFTVARYETYPREAPTSYVVGFNVICPSNGQTIYRDCTVDFTALPPEHTELDVLHAAWDSMKTGIMAWFTDVKDRCNIVGTSYVPNEFVEPEPAPETPEAAQEPSEPEPAPETPEAAQEPSEPEPAPETPEA